MELNLNNVISGKGTLYNPPIKIVTSRNEKVKFGKFCAIGPNLIIRGNDSHDYNFPAIQKKFYEKYFGLSHPLSYTSDVNNNINVEIGNDVWIGEDVFILSDRKTIKIGDGCCIGARSVITKDLEPYSICVGTPCKMIKKRYSQEIINYLLELKWWDWDDDKIKNNKEFFNSNLNILSIDEIKKIIK
jgi:virginiamycin A acetyltransferase